METVRKVVILLKFIESVQQRKRNGEMRHKNTCFDGEEYDTWKQRIKMYLKMKKCQEVITRKKDLTKYKEEWDEKDIIAINYIYSALSNKQMEYVKKFDTTYEIMEELDKRYSKESTALQIICRNRLEKMKLNRYSNTATFTNEFEKAINELSAAGAKITEQEKLNYMLNTLPSSYSYIGDLIDALLKEDQTVAYVKNKLEIAERKHEDENEARGTNAFTSHNQQQEGCFKCGRGGHYARECRESWRGSIRGRGRGESGSGRGTKHGLFNGANRGSNSGRGRDSFWNACGKGGRGGATAAAKFDQRDRSGAGA